jgi:serine/threonine protein kinase
MIGSTLSGRYKVSSVLGAGGMGRTYVAQDTLRPGHPTCVVKQLKPASDDAGVLEIARRLFATEAEILEQLGNHDQVPRLLAYFEQDHEFYLVQEFIDGHPLSFELPQGQTWSEERVIVLLQEILCVLAFIHEQNVIHRDIKPDNIIRRQRDQRLVLIDFGAVKQVRLQQPTIVGQASVTVAIGTPGYMPTEQSSGKPRPSSDIYAVGMIGIQALTGMLPTYLHEDDDGEVVWQHLTQVSDGLAHVINKMVRHYFKHRYQTATEALQALQQLTNAPPLSATNVGLATTQFAAGWAVPSGSFAVGRSAPFSTASTPPSIPPQVAASGVPLVPVLGNSSPPSVPPTHLSTLPSVPPTQAVSPSMPSNPSVPPQGSEVEVPQTYVASNVASNVAKAPGGFHPSASASAGAGTPSKLSVPATPAYGQAFRPGNPLYAPHSTHEQTPHTVPAHTTPSQGTIALPSPNRLLPDASQVQAPRSKSSNRLLLLGGIALLLLIGGAVYAVMSREQQPAPVITAPSPEALPEETNPSPNAIQENIPAPAPIAPLPDPLPRLAPPPASVAPVPTIPSEPAYIPEPEPAYIPEPAPSEPSPVPAPPTASEPEPTQVPTPEPPVASEPEPAPSTPAVEEVPYFEVPDF